MSKLTVAKVVAKLSVMGYDLITSKYELVSANGKTLNNHKLSYILKDTQDKTGRLTFTDGRKSFKNGLAIDISIADDYDLQRPLKVQNRGEFINLLTIDYEEEDIILAKVENQYKQNNNNVQYDSVDTYSDKLEEIQKYFKDVLKEMNRLDNNYKNIHETMINKINSIEKFSGQVSDQFETIGKEQKINFKKVRKYALLIFITLFLYNSLLTYLLYLILK